MPTRKRKTGIADKVEYDSLGKKRSALWLKVVFSAGSSSTWSAVLSSRRITSAFVELMGSCEKERGDLQSMLSGAV